MKYRANGPEQTHALGRALGMAAGENSVFALYGDLGAGKTVLAQGIAEGLGVPSAVTSPTFVIMQMHEGGRLDLFHVDLYRLNRTEEVDEIGIEERFGEGVVVIEWPERCPDILPVDRMDIHFEFTHEGRELTLHSTGAQHHHFLDVIRM